MKDFVERMTFEENAVLRGEAFEAIDFVTSLTVPRYYRVTMPSNRALFLQVRDISGDIGPIIYSVFPDATGITDNGDPVQIDNRRTGGRQSTAVIQPVNVATPNAGTKQVLAIARGDTTGNAARSTRASGPGADRIYQQNLVLIVGVEAPETVPNFRLNYKWIEIDPLENFDD